MTRPQYEPTAWTATVAATVQAERAAAGLTIDQLADRAGLSPITLHRLLHDQRAMTIAQLAMLAPVFGMSASQLLAEAERRSARNTQRTVRTNRKATP